MFDCTKPLLDSIYAFHWSSLSGVSQACVLPFEANHCTSLAACISVDVEFQSQK